MNENIAHIKSYICQDKNLSKNNKTQKSPSGKNDIIKNDTNTFFQFDFFPWKNFVFSYYYYLLVLSRKYEAIKIRQNPPYLRLVHPTFSTGL
jgi:hypothetical protein